MEKVTIHNIVVSNPSGGEMPLATGDIGILESEGGAPVRLSFTPNNGLPLGGDPLSISFEAPAEAPQGPFDNLELRGVSPDNVAELHAPAAENAGCALSAVPVIPGAGVVGWGFNIFGRYDESSKLRQLFDLGAPRVERIYEREYEVPSGVSHDTGGGFQGTSHFFSSREDYQSHLSAKASVSGSYGAFSAEFSAEYGSVRKRENEYQYLVFDAAVRTWGLSLKNPAPDKLLPSVTGDADFRDLPRQYIPPQGNDPGNGQLFFHFFKKFGTHFVGTVQMGGSLVYNAYLNKSHQYDEDTASAKATLEYNALFVKARAEASVSWKSIGQKWTEDRKVSVRGVGGTRPLIITNPSFNENVHEKFEAWLATVPDNPAAVDFTLKPISQLFSGERARAVEQAFQAYANSRVFMSAVYVDRTEPLAEPTLLISGAPIAFKPDLNDGIFAYWAVVVKRSTLQVVLNRAFAFNNQRYKSVAEYFSEIQSKLEPFNDRNHILALTTTKMHVQSIPQGPLYSLLLSCGGGNQLKQLEEWAVKRDSTTHARVTYCLLGVMGNGPGSGAEAMASSSNGDSSPVLCELSKPLLPDSDRDGQIVWTPESS